jgi:hypothetical protein
MPKETAVLTAIKEKINSLVQIKLQSILSRLHYVKEIRYRMFYLVKRLMYKVM